MTIGDAAPGGPAMTALGLALVLTAAPAFCRDLVPAVSGKLDADAAEVRVRPSWRLGSGATLASFLKAGLLAPFGALPDPYATLRPSPYGEAGASLRLSGAVEALVMGTAGYARLNSARAIADPQGLGASPASGSAGRSEFSQDWLTGSVYADAGMVVRLSRRVAEAFFVAVDAFGYAALGAMGGLGHHGESLWEGNLGGLWMYKDRALEASWFAGLRLEGARQNSFNNDRFTASAGVAAGAEVALQEGRRRVSGGVEASLRPSDVGVRPSLQVTRGPASALVAADLRKGLDPFYPDSIGVGAEVTLAPVRGLAVTAGGRYRRESYALAPAPIDDFTGYAVASLDFDRLATGWRGSLPALRPYDPAPAAALSSRVPGDGYEAVFAAALQEQPTYEGFVRRIPVRGTDDVLAAVSAFTASFGVYNYNTSEGSPENVDDIGQLYARGRASYLSGQSDPTLVCLGAAQFAAALARDLGLQAGIPIEASAVTVTVPDGSGASSGHAVAAVKMSTPEYGIVFVDWGKLTPTYTYSTERALAIYQALQGIPGLFHDVTSGRDGRHVGYLFSEDGKAFMRSLTFEAEAPADPVGRVFGDAPRGQQLTLQRFRESARARLRGR